MKYFLFSVLLLFSVNVGKCQNAAFYGTAVFVGRQSKVFVADAAYVTIRFSSGTKTIEVKSDSNGD